MFAYKHVVLGAFGLISAAFVGLAVTDNTVYAADKPVQKAAGADNPSIERGRYLLRITGCNDCHTPGYAQGGGKVPESEWLTGVPVGFKGPWGVSYATNLRLTMQALTEEGWLKAARAERLPPMPWFALRDMKDEDLRAIYRFIRSLGPKGAPAPKAVPPGAPVKTPFVVFEPQAPAADK